MWDPGLRGRGKQPGTGRGRSRGRGRGAGIGENQPTLRDFLARAAGKGPEGGLLGPRSKEATQPEQQGEQDSNHMSGGQGLACGRSGPGSLTDRTEAEGIEGKGPGTRARKVPPGKKEAEPEK